MISKFKENFEKYGMVYVEKEFSPFNRTDLKCLENYCDEVKKEHIKIGDAGESNYLWVGRFQTDKDRPRLVNKEISTKLFKIINKVNISKFVKNVIGCSDPVFIRRVQYNQIDPNGFINVGSYKNVRMVSSGINTFELIDNSQAVCTIAGTAAWEAAVRSKPVMLYGSLWHQGCKSIFVIKTFKEAVNAVNKIVDGFIPDRDDVDRYAEAVYRSCVHGLISSHFFSERISKCPDPEYTMELLGKAFYDAYELYYGSSN